MTDSRGRSPAITSRATSRAPPSTPASSSSQRRCPSASPARPLRTFRAAISVVAATRSPKHALSRMPSAASYAPDSRAHREEQQPPWTVPPSAASASSSLARCCARRRSSKRHRAPSNAFRVFNCHLFVPSNAFPVFNCRLFVASEPCVTLGQAALCVGLLDNVWPLFESKQLASKVRTPRWSGFLSASPLGVQGLLGVQSLGFRRLRRV